jgi:signal peptidase I
MSWFSRSWTRFKVQAPTFKKGSESRGVLKECLFISTAVFGIANYGVGFTKCKGESMLPTLDPEGEWALVSIMPYVFLGEDYKVGDVVISKSVEEPEKSE